MAQRITENEIAKMIKYINSLESHVNPQDVARYRNGDLWSYDYFAHEGVYLRRGIVNPTHTSYRLSTKEAWIFLTGVQFVLESEYRKLTQQ